MNTFTGAEFNVLFKNTPEVVEQDLHQLEKGTGAQLVALNEAGPTVDKGVDAFVKRMAWQQLAPGGVTNRILWNPDEWRAEPFFGHRRISDRGPTKAPPRSLVWQGLYHRPSKTRHLVYSTHVTAGYAREDGKPGSHGWRDVLAQQGLLRIAATVAEHAAERGEDFPYQHLWGDLNCGQRNRQEWWYPHPLLEAFFVRDTMPKAIDYMMHSHRAAAAGLKVGRRYSFDRGLDSDHRAQVKVHRLN